MDSLERLEDEARTHGWILRASYQPKTRLWTLEFGPEKYLRSQSGVDVEECAQVIERDMFRLGLRCMAEGKF